MNKKLILTLIFPLTIIVFSLFTKYWIVYVIDGYDCVMYGFPFIYKAPVLGLSMTDNYFIIEFVADFSIYFLTITLIVYLIDKFIFTLRILKIISIILYLPAFWMMSILLPLVFNTENYISLKNNNHIEIKKTGFDTPFYHGNRMNDFLDYKK